MTSKASILDVTSPDFDVDAYLSYQLKEKTLDELVKEEENMVNSVRRLDSDVHQLVYENYNKFLTATNTVRKMQSEFNGLVEEMDTLSSSMNKVSSLIGELSTVGKEARQANVAQLNGSYKALSSLQFIYQLPATIQALLDDRQFSEVVRLDGLARRSLARFSDVKDVADMTRQLDAIRARLESELYSTISGRVENVDSAVEAVQLLAQLGAPADSLQSALLSSAEKCLQSDLDALKEQPADVLDLVDRGCSSFLPDMQLFSQLHRRLFPHHPQHLTTSLAALCQHFHELITNHLMTSSDPQDCSIVVRALDRYYRKMCTCAHHIGPGILDFSGVCVKLINDVALHEIANSRAKIADDMGNVIRELREALLDGDADLPHLIARFEHSFVHLGKTALANMLLFSASDCTFSTLPESEFQWPLCSAVHGELVLGAARDVCAAVAKYAEMRMVSPSLLLVLGVSTHHLATRALPSLIGLANEQFDAAARGSRASDGDEVVEELRTTAQLLIRRYAHQCGLSIGEDLARSSEWAAATAAPTAVRAVVRRAADEVSDAESMLCKVLGGEPRRGGASGGGATGARRDLPRDSLWSERIDFHAHIHMNKSSMLTAVVRVMLKSLVEAIRLRTFSRNALQQVQVDCHFLQQRLCHLVADEVAVNALIDSALSSALRRCSDPVLLHPSALTALCDADKA